MPHEWRQIVAMTAHRTSPLQPVLAVVEWEWRPLCGRGRFDSDSVIS
jgi:hypothetical protein